VDVELIGKLGGCRREHGRREVAAGLSVRAARIQRLSSYVQRMESPISKTLSNLKPWLQLRGFLGSSGPSQFTLLGSVSASRPFSTDAALFSTDASDAVLVDSVAAGPASASAIVRRSVGRQMLPM
jgi:hypothetical protein